MTIRYDTLASLTLRTAYDEAMGKMRRQFTLTPVGKPIIPDKVCRGPAQRDGLPPRGSVRRPAHHRDARRSQGNPHRNTGSVGEGFLELPVDAYPFQGGGFAA
jgi:hypothetical protein